MVGRLAVLLATLSAGLLASAVAAPGALPPPDPLAPVALPSIFEPSPGSEGLLTPAALTDALPPATGHAEAVEPPSTAQATRLGAPPAGLFLMLQGIFCVAFFRGRRKLAALLVAALAASRSGVSSLPRLLCGPRHATALPCEPKLPRGLVGLNAAAVDQSARTASNTYAPYTELPSCTPPTQFALPDGTGFAFAAPTSRTSLPPAVFHPPLFARPPPLAS